MEGRLKKQLYRSMLRIRGIEEAIATAYAKQQMRCPVHLSIGQEATPVGICAQLSTEDHIFSGHRCHAHYLAKGGNLNKMIAELHGKVTGCAKGKGGSMHLVDTSVGMMGSSALVSGTIPLGVGNALSFVMDDKPKVVVVFFGDAGSEQGVFYESLNFAALKKLPVIFACENNFYATYSHQDKRQATPHIFRRGETFGIPGVQVNGNDVEAVYQASQKAISRAKAGEGPTLMEFTTYRWRDHVGPNYDYELGYRTKAEVESWMEKCPVRRTEKLLREAGILSLNEKKEILEQIKNDIELAFAWAEGSAYPSTEEIFTDIYA